MNNLKFHITLYFSFVITAFSFGQELDTTDVNYKVFFYENGVKSSEGILIDGKPEGIWKAYYENGQLKTKGGRKENLLDGEWFFYREDGTLDKLITYKQNKKEGKEEIYNSEGLLSERLMYADGLKSGLAQRFYSTGEISKEYVFENGKENGKGFEYGTDGRIISFISYKNGYLKSFEKVNRYSSNGLKTGRWIDYVPGTSRIKEEGNYSNGKRNGMFKIYDRRGNLDRIENYKNGVLQDENSAEILDVKREIGKDGKVKSVGSFSKGKKQGIFREYDEDGKIKSSTIYENDIKTAEGKIDGKGVYQGSWKLYYPAGELKAEGEYKNGKKEGKWKFYFIDGKLEQKGNYKKGLETGEWVWYFETGETKRQEYYRKGKEDGESIEYDDEGKVINSGNYVDGLRTGNWLLTIGDYEEKGEFIDDEKNGYWRYFYKDTEQLSFEGEYSLGVPIKKHTYYFPNGTVLKEGKFQGGERHGDWKFYNEDGTLKLSIRYTSGLETRLNGEKI